MVTSFHGDDPKKAGRERVDYHIGGGRTKEGRRAGGGGSVLSFCVAVVV